MNIADIAAIVNAGGGGGGGGGTTPSMMDLFDLVLFVNNDDSSAPIEIIKGEYDAVKGKLERGEPCIGWVNGSSVSDTREDGALIFYFEYIEGSEYINLQEFSFSAGTIFFLQWHPDGSVEWGN